MKKIWCLKMSWDASKYDFEATLNQINFVKNTVSYNHLQ